MYGVLYSAEQNSEVDITAIVVLELVELVSTILQHIFVGRVRIIDTADVCLAVRLVEGEVIDEYITRDTYRRIYQAYLPVLAVV